MSQAGAVNSSGGGGGGSLDTLTGNTGGPISPTLGNINTVGSGSITVAGNVGTSTLTAQVTGLTNHNVLVGAGTDTITKVAPSATAGVPLVSTGAAADPAFGTAVVAGGGTGATSFTAYSVICGGTTSTDPLQNVSGVGTAGQVLTSNGAAALPTWQAGGGGSSGLVLVQTQTATNSSSIDFINLTAYDVYFVTITGCGPGSNGFVLTMQVSQDNGSTFLNSGYANGLNYSSFSTGTLSNSNSTSHIPLTTDVNNNTIASNFYIYNTNLGSPLQIQGFSTWQDGSNTVNTGFFNGQTPTGITAIRFIFTGGSTIAAGTFSLYGLAS